MPGRRRALLSSTRFSASGISSLRYRTTAYATKSAPRRSLSRSTRTRASPSSSRTTRIILKSRTHIIRTSSCAYRWARPLTTPTACALSRRNCISRARTRCARSSPTGRRRRTTPSTLPKGAILISASGTITCRASSCPRARPTATHTSASSAKRALPSAIPITPRCTPSSNTSWK